METIREKLEELNRLVLEGKALQAFDRFYHQDVVMQENDQPPTVGKQANRAREEAFFSQVTEFRNAIVLAVAESGPISFVIWRYDYTHREWGVRNYTQVSIQHWQDGFIIKEQFIYGN